jgi:hypothetical protein
MKMRAVVAALAVPFVLGSCAAGSTDDRAALHALYDDALWNIDIPDLAPMVDSVHEPEGCEESGQEPVASRDWRTESGRPPYSVIELVHDTAIENGWTVENLVSQEAFASHAAGGVLTATKKSGDLTLQASVGISQITQDEGWRVSLVASVREPVFCA